MASAIKKGSLREVCVRLLWNNVINLCRDFAHNYLYAEPTAAQRSEVLGCCWCITRKYFGASSKNISAHHPKIFLDIPQKYSSGICWKYFRASPGNILAGLEQFLCNATNQVWQIRLWGLQPVWHIYCPGKFETLVNLSFHSYIFFVAEFTKTVRFWNVVVDLQKVAIAAACAICIY